jgi:hypothetical protein
MRWKKLDARVTLVLAIRRRRIALPAHDAEFGALPRRKL